MARLEADYPNVKFVYMTGHVDIGDDADNKAVSDDYPHSELELNLNSRRAYQKTFLKADRYAFLLGV